jgi:Rieske Fe-S protein
MAALNRRGFVNWFLGTSAGAAVMSMLYPVVRFMSPPEVPEAGVHEIDAGATNDPEFLDKGFRIIRFGAEAVIVIRVSDTDFRAFAGTCTHLDCIVEFRRAEQRIWCNCHNGGYDLTGRNIIGPPPKPLEAFQVDLADDAEGRPKRVIVSRA